MAVVATRPFAADSDMALAALIRACERKPAVHQLLNTRDLLPYFTPEEEAANLRKRNTPGAGKDRARQVTAKKPKASKPQAPAAPVALSVTRRAPTPKPAPAPTPSKAVGVKLAAEGKPVWAGPSSFISPKPEALPKPSLSLLRKA